MRLACLLFVAASFAACASEDDFARQRREMVAEIAAMHADVDRRERLDAAVLDAVGRVHRHRFVPAALQPWAYVNRPLPIGHDQTISQPYIVALMTHLMKPAKNHRVLEVGTGSGYQAAVLAELVEKVYTIEIVEPLARSARERLQSLGYRNIEVRAGDGYKGWPEAAPFDSIIVTAGAPELPQPLVAQLKPGGRIVIPVGPEGGIQELIVIAKRPDGSLDRRVVIPVRFVPLTRKK
jgi:protein-L-isoaspartate(D-aspartate) O-methyltransferase